MFVYGKENVLCWCGRVYAMIVDFQFCFLSCNVYRAASLQWLDLEAPFDVIYSYCNSALIIHLLHTGHVIFVRKRSSKVAGWNKLKLARAEGNSQLLSSWVLYVLLTAFAIRLSLSSNYGKLAVITEKRAAEEKESDKQCSAVRVSKCVPKSCHSYHISTENAIDEALIGLRRADAR